MNIRNMNLDDLDKIMEIEKRIFSSPFTKEGYIKDYNDNPFSLYKVLEVDDKIIGYVFLWVIFERAQIITIAVDLDYQGKGYGKILMDDVISECVEKNIEDITLEVRISNQRAIELYEKFGFEVATIRKNYYADGENAYLMVKNVNN